MEMSLPNVSSAESSVGRLHHLLALEETQNQCPVRDVPGQPCSFLGARRSDRANSSSMERSLSSPEAAPVQNRSAGIRVT